MGSLGIWPGWLGVIGSIVTARAEDSAWRLRRAPQDIIDFMAARGLVGRIMRAAGRAHYLPDTTPAHEMRGRSADGMMPGPIREGLVSELGHAAYLGAELTRAEAALGFGLSYEQDRPLHR
jgi:hypothetical protein